MEGYSIRMYPGVLRTQMTRLAGKSFTVLIRGTCKIIRKACIAKRDEINESESFSCCHIMT